MDEKRHRIHNSMTLTGASQVLIVLVFTFIGADWKGWGGAVGGFSISYLVMGIQTIGMWTTSNLVGCMIRAGKLDNERPIYWLYSWPMFVWRARKFALTDKYIPDF